MQKIKETPTQIYKDIVKNLFENNEKDFESKEIEKLAKQYHKRCNKFDTEKIILATEGKIAIYKMEDLFKGTLVQIVT